jgi:WD repeat-containing protein 24
LHGLASQSESGSNVPTPLARPVREMPLIPPSDEHSLEQDPKASTVPLWQQRRASVQLTSPQASARDHSNLRPIDNLPPITDTKDAESGQMPPSFAELPDLEQRMEERRNAMNNYRARPRTVLRLDNPSNDGTSLATGLPHLDRHDSNESFQMFSGSTDSDPRSIALAGSFGESHSLDTSAANSLGSSVTQEFTAGNQMRQSQLRHSHRVTSPPDGSGESQAARSTESPLFENMSFPMEHEPEARSEQMTDEDPRPVQRPSAMVSPVVHRDLGIDDQKLVLPCVPSLLLANPPPPAVEPPPWTLSALLPPLLEYHLETLCDTQLPSILALWLYPICPALFSQSPPPPTYLLAYHELLICLRLFIEAAALRNSAQFIFPDIGLETTVDQGRGTGADQTGLWCTECSKPVKGDVRGWCKRCCSEWAECAICELACPPSSTDIGGFEAESTSRQDPTLSPSTALWSWCQGCGHGGHTGCLRSWWRTVSGASGPDSSDGACPVVGCNHACASGPRRDARLAAIVAASKRERSSSVARDSWIAGESRAVEAATRTLSGRGSSSGVAKAVSAPGIAFGSGPGRTNAEEAVVIVDPERGSADPSKEGIPRSLSGGGRSLSGGGRSLSGGGRRVRLALPGTTPPAVASAIAGLRETSEREAELLG